MKVKLMANLRKIGNFVRTSKVFMFYGSDGDHTRTNDMRIFPIHLLRIYIALIL
jgi:hypothetical protein